MPPPTSAATEHRAVVAASRSRNPFRVRSPSLPLSPCIFLSSSSALQAGNRELRLAGHGAAVVQAAEALFQRPSLSFSARLNPSRRFLIQWLRSKDTLSLLILQLRPYNYFGVNPRSFACFTVSVFFLSKAYFRSDGLKYVFNYLQICHSTCFSRKIFVLTPIRSVQVALGS